MPSISIAINNLRREFHLDRLSRKTSGESKLVALADINLEIFRGELFGLLGPNGAGKTTLIRILCTLLTPTSGSATIEGFDIRRDLNRVRSIINMVSGGETCGYGILTPEENLRLFTELYGIPWRIAKPRVEKMLKVVGLDKYRGVRVNKLSTGMKQRVNFARGFTTDPKVLFLDEPTVGLDVHSARDIRSFISDWMAENPSTTIMLTTHYMTEADEMCDRIAIIDRGVVQACDTPANLKRMVQKETSLDLSFAGLEPLPDTWRQLPGVVNMAAEADAETRTQRLRVLLESPDAGGNFLREAAANGRRLLSLRTVEPTLEDVFIKLTGRTLSETAPTEEGVPA